MIFEQVYEEWDQDPCAPAVDILAHVPHPNDFLGLQQKHQLVLIVSTARGLFARLFVEDPDRPMEVERASQLSCLPAPELAGLLLL